ncbi:uncharacterized protein LOC119341621 [Triticum dicoccoides]|uniref:uncharacterized protein LOC119341621 n=1 Tax=Triticum dicoccoides TaxID=85692 RepID=UPI001890EF6F|nr:uncharacterized protein LOC119341621 [Triticum dicoccoides]
MGISPSPTDRAAAPARLPPVRYYVPAVWEIKREEDPVHDPDSPQSPSQIGDDVPPLVFPNPNPSPSWLSRRTAFERHLPATHDEPPPSPPPPEEQPARRPEDEDPDLYFCLKDPNDPECVRRCHEVQSKRYAVHALRGYNADSGNGVKYELVEGSARSNSILLDCAEILGHVVFTARPAAAGGGRDRTFFGEVRMPDHALACMISLDDDRDCYYRGAAANDDELCQFCRKDLRHPEVHPEIRRPPRGTSATETIMDCD